MIAFDVLLRSRDALDLSPVTRESGLEPTNYAITTVYSSLNIVIIFIMKRYYMSLQITTVYS